MVASPGVVGFDIHNADIASVEVINEVELVENTSRIGSHDDEFFTFGNLASEVAVASIGIFEIWEPVGLDVRPCYLYEALGFPFGRESFHLCNSFLILEISRFLFVFGSVSFSPRAASTL